MTDWDADLRVISLGAGVQSSTLLYLAVEGELQVDAAVFADTQNEPQRVYEHLGKLEKLAADAGIEFRRVTRGNLGERVLLQDQAPGAEGSKHYVTIPLHTTDPQGRASMVRRVCTHDYKIVPIRRTVRELMRERGASKVDQLIGISWDELGRMRESDVKFSRNVYPLVERRMSRTDCMRWIAEHGYPMPAKSACIWCPFHPDAQWRDLKENSPEEWAEAVEFDRAIRTGGPMGRPLDGEAFVHRSRIPLELVDLRTPEQKGQASLFGDETGFEEVCDGGVCGV